MMMMSSDERLMGEMDKGDSLMGYPIIMYIAILCPLCKCQYDLALTRLLSLQSSSK